MTTDTLALRAVTAVLAAGVALGLMHIACVIGFHVPFDPNEGWNAYFAQAAAATGSPYPAAQSLMINNYPPLSFYLVGALARLTGDAVIAGRIVALASLFALALGIETAARRMGCDRLEAAFAALFFTARRDADQRLCRDGRSADARPRRRDRRIDHRAGRAAHTAHDGAGGAFVHTRFLRQAQPGRAAARGRGVAGAAGPQAGRDPLPAAASSSH